mmetsp:Transcript_24718/g.57624  ORF Transcript_24718/g.57624 Transcript_24718/m.57624 type:complete len:136 (-) Transcript_24718:2617-3024(-)
MRLYGYLRGSLCSGWWRETATASPVDSIVGILVGCSHSGAGELLDWDHGQLFVWVGVLWIGWGTKCIQTSHIIIVAPVECRCIGNGVRGTCPCGGVPEGIGDPLNHFMRIRVRVDERTDEPNPRLTQPKPDDSFN